MCIFDKASAAGVYQKKLQALPIGRWKSFDTRLGNAYQTNVRILGVKFRITV
jgi:hypothetical protein